MTNAAYLVILAAGTLVFILGWQNTSSYQAGFGAHHTAQGVER
jgi:hypothetical protein